MANIKGTQTEKNLIGAFAGESQARNRYTYFSSKARDDGYIQISQIFAETADQESEHAKRFFGFLEGGDVEVQAAFPAGVVGTTADNLNTAAAGEHFEWTELYPGFAKVAREEGFEAVAAVFENVSVAEKQHDKRYSELVKNVEDGTVFEKESPTVWRCINCGYVYEGKAAPKACPACAHPQAYYELLGENW